VKATTRLRQLLASGKTLVAPGAHDAMTAMVLEKVGFDLIYMTGYGTAAAMGMPDVGLATIGEMIRNAQYMASAVSIPIVADSDTGGGNAVNVVRTIREYIQAGVAGIHMEDQVTPKRSGHWAGKRLIPIEEAVGKIRAAVDTRDRLDRDFVIVARTDARAAVGGGVDEAIRRGNAYADAGADLVFFESPFSEEEVERAAREIRVKLMVLPGGLSPYIPLERMSRMGIGITILAALSFRAVGKATYDAGVLIREQGIEGYRRLIESTKGHPMDDFNAFINKDLADIEARYLPTELTASFKQGPTA
jgi:2-methylisocitrate lyase-like PEP mutase family enzyme